MYAARRRELDFKILGYVLMPGHFHQSRRPEAGGSAWRLAVVKLEVLLSE